MQEQVRVNEEETSAQVVSMVCTNVVDEKIVEKVFLPLPSEGRGRKAPMAEPEVKTGVSSTCKLRQ